MLRALDTVNEQFRAVQDHEPLEPADPQLLDELHHLCRPESEDEAHAEVEEPVIEDVVEEIVEPEIVASAPVSAVAAESIDDITEDEFEKLLDELHGKGRAPGADTQQVEPAAQAPQTPAPTPASSDAGGDITDDEFERLLDELHGKGKGPSVNTPAEPEKPKAPAPTTKASTPKSSSDSDLMTDEEFEKLLDELHGVGKGPSIEELEMATRPGKRESKASSCASA